MNIHIAGLSRKPAFARPILIAAGFESNSASQALNFALPFSKLLPRPYVQHFNNSTFKFENLHIGINNVIDHTNILTSEFNHGFEAPIADRAEAGDFPALPVFTEKWGHGGSLISQWAPDSVYYEKLLDRAQASLQMLKNPQIFVIDTLGINSYINQNLSAADFKAGKKELHARIRTDLNRPDIVFLCLQFMPSFEGAVAYNAKQLEMQAEDPNCFVIDTTGAATQDSYHWNSAGIHLIGNRVIDKILEIISV